MRVENVAPHLTRRQSLTMSGRSPIVFPACRTVSGVPVELIPMLGGPLALVVVLVKGAPSHALVSMVVLYFVSGLGITAGFHRLFTHRSFATSRPMEWLLMIVGCMAGQSSPFFWIATHRAHHQFTDHEGDPHSPYLWDGKPLGFWRGLWHSHFGWIPAGGYGYRAHYIADLTGRKDLAWIDRHWFLWYAAGLGLPAAIGFLVGGTAYDAVMGFLCGGLLRHFASINATFAVNSITHLWGTQPFPTGDQSRNNLVVGLLALGEGWHNNHHAFPSSARHGFHWTQPDLTWSFIWILARLGLVWEIKLPRLKA